MKNFAGTRVGTSPMRKMAVYLPAGYDDSSKHYPVIYFLPSPSKKISKAKAGIPVWEPIVGTGVMAT